MNQAQTVTLVTTILQVLGSLLAMHGYSATASTINAEDTSGAVLVIISWLFAHVFHGTNAPTPPPSAGQSQSVPVKVVPLLILAGMVTLFSGCASLAPGADPIVVNAERTETIAQAGFDAVLGLEDANRPFWETNAPAFHEFCTWLRTPVPVVGAQTVAVLPRDLALVWNLDQVKVAYKSGQTSSNAVFEAVNTLSAALAQANAWLTTESTNTPTP